MRVLILCSKFPYPPKDGGSIATLNTIKALSRKDHEITVLSMNTAKHPSPTDKLPIYIQKLARFSAVPVDNRVRWFPALKNLFTGRSYHLDRFECPEFDHQLQALLSEDSFDIVQSEGIIPLLYLQTIRSNYQGPVLLRTHNIEHQIWEEMSRQTSNPLKKGYLSLQTQRLKKAEQWYLRQVEGIAAITETDAKYLSALTEAPVRAISPALDLPDKHTPPPPQPSVFHIGAMDWPPNIQGLRWFLQTIWPNVHDQVPSLPLYLAGRNTPDWFRQYHRTQNIQVEGEVPDAHQFMGDKGLMVVPLWAGSGIRIKIIEAMAKGKPVITTPKGAEGIPATHQEHLFIAEGEDEFQSLLTDYHQNPEKFYEVGEEGKAFVKNIYKLGKVGDRLQNFYQTLLTR